MMESAGGRRENTDNSSGAWDVLDQTSMFCLPHKPDERSHHHMDRDLAGIEKVLPVLRGLANLFLQTRA